MSKQTHVRCWSVVIVIITAVILVVVLVAGMKISAPPINTQQPQGSFADLELPAYSDAQYLIHCDDGRYTVYYSTEHNEAVWVAYLLTRAEVSYKGTDRNNKFIPDPVVEQNGWGKVRTSYYTGTGYDRGHLCPSADRDDNRTENDATFRLSNIAPQTPALNRQIWRFLEDRVREWTIKYDSLYIVTGGVLKEGLPKIKGAVSIPEQFYKIVLCSVNGTWQAAGFIIPNTNTVAGTFWDYSVTVDSVESLTGLDFYPALPDETANAVEAVVERNLW